MHLLWVTFYLPLLFDCKTSTLIFIWALNNNFPSFASVKRVGLLEVVIGLGSLDTKEFGEGGWNVLWIESVLSGDVEVDEGWEAREPAQHRGGVTVQQRGRVSRQESEARPVEADHLEAVVLQ